MAYSFGGGVRPELGKTDYSGYLQGALTGAQGVAAGGSAIGQGIANAGQQIGTAVKEYYIKKEKKQLSNQANTLITGMIKKYPEQAQNLFGIQIGADGNPDPGAVKSIVDSLTPAGAMGLFQNLNKEEEAKDLATQTASVTRILEGQGSMDAPVDRPDGYDPRAIQAGRNQALNNQYIQSQITANTAGKAPNAFTAIYNNGVRAWVEENPDTKITGTVLKKIATDAQKAAASGNSVTVQAPQPIPDKGWKYNYNEQGQVVSQSMIPGGPAELEALGKKQSSENLSIALGDMAGALVGLANLNATVSPTQTGAENISSKVRGSAAGQFVGAAMGTQEQSFRQQYSNIKPVVLNAVRNATNMSAKAMDSDVELKLYLSQLGHENNDIISNVAALHAINQQYGGLSDVIKQVMAGLTDPEMRKAVYARLGEMLDKGAEASRNAKPQPKRAAKLISVRPSGK
jgi:hypothetical protein